MFVISLQDFNNDTRFTDVSIGRIGPGWRTLKPSGASGVVKWSGPPQYLTVSLRLS